MHSLSVLSICVFVEGDGSAVSVWMLTGARWANDSTSVPNSQTYNDCESSLVIPS